MADGGFLLLERRFLKRAIEYRRVLRPVSAQIVERARRDQRFEDALVAEAQIDAIGEIVERRERPLFACREDRIDRRPTDVANGAEAESDCEAAVAVILRARSLAVILRERSDRGIYCELPVAGYQVRTVDPLAHFVRSG